MREYHLDGLKIDSLKNLFIEFANMVHGRTDLGKQYGQEGYFGNNIESFDDCLFGGFGLENPCRIIWQSSEKSRFFLGHKAYLDYCDSAIKNKDYIDEDGLKYLMKDRELAAAGKGQTVFSLLVDSIKSVDERSNGRNRIELVLKWTFRRYYVDNWKEMNIES